MRIKNGTLYPIEGSPIANGFVDFENGKITACGSLSQAPAYEGEIFDAEGGCIFPGLIDAHTHIGISEEGLRWEGEDCNEESDPVTPEMRAFDAINPFDTAIAKARKAGVVTVGVSPGSANVIGGQIAAIKLWGNSVEEMQVKPVCAMKFALGENPKHTYGISKNRAPMTRMAVAALMRKTLEEARRYLRKKEAGEDLYDAQKEALIPVLKGEIPVHFHAHRPDDIQTAVRIAEEFGLRYSILHTTGGSMILPWLVEKKVSVVVGPSTGPSSKPETAGESFITAGLMEKAGLKVAITTDHDVTPLWMLPVYAAMNVREGMSEQAALEAITIQPARVLGLEDRVGSIRPGKDADLVVFTGHPFDFRTKTRAVFVNGMRTD